MYIRGDRAMMSYSTEEVALNKLIILYLIKMSPIEFTKDSLTEFILDKGYMNYFALQQYLVELTEGDLIKLDNTYILNEKGLLTLNLLGSKISESLKNEIHQEFKLQEDNKVKESQVVGEFFLKENNQYTVNLKLIENEDTLFSLYFDVANEAQAAEFCKMWKEDTEKIYQQILGIFITK